MGGQPERKETHTHLGFLTVGNRWEGDHLALCVHDAGIHGFSLQELQVSARRRRVE